MPSLLQPGSNTGALTLITTAALLNSPHQNSPGLRRTLKGKQRHRHHSLTFAVHHRKLLNPKP